MGKTGLAPDFRVYREARAAFDAVAATYDQTYGSADPLKAWMRRQSLALLAAVLPEKGRFVEVGCGTGEEAIFLARRGAHVWVTDISPAMVARAWQKARAAGVGSRVHPLVIPAGSLAALRPRVPFDGMYSSFGALNCEPHLDAWAEAAARLVRPGGVLVCSVVNRWCLWDVVWFGVHGQWREATRRWARGWRPARLASGNAVVTLLTRTLTCGELRALLTPAFRVERVLALPVLLPPPYLAPLYARYRGFFRRLERAELAVRERWPWRHLGDHIVVVARRVA